jgi:hypothetical protein
VVGAFAQSTTLTQIQDTVYTSSGAPFNGTVVITWTGTTSSSGAGPSNTSVRISNGVLSVQLAPSTNITPVAYYQAVYNSSDGLTTWTQAWAVPPSSTPVTLSQIIVTNTTTSGGGGGTGGSGGTSSPISITQVTGLTSDLNAINSSLSTFNSVTQSLNLMISNLSNTVNSLSNTVGSIAAGSTTANFVDAETPSGNVNGTNVSFSLANTPSLPTDVLLYKNGIVQLYGIDYTVSGSTITFASGEPPMTGDELKAYYRIAGTGPASSFIDDETPVGVINGTNLSFTLANAPAPTGSLKLFKNGTLMVENVDYTLSSQVITFTTASTGPATGDSLVAFYRITSLNSNSVVNRGATVSSRPGHSDRLP